MRKIVVALAIFAVFVLIAPFAAGTIEFKHDSPVSYFTDVLMNENRIQNVSAPVDAKDVATKEYVDAASTSSSGEPLISYTFDCAKSAPGSSTRPNTTTAPSCTSDRVKVCEGLIHTTDAPLDWCRFPYQQLNFTVDTDANRLKADGRLLVKGTSDLNADPEQVECSYSICSSY